MPFWKLLPGPPRPAPSELEFDALRQGQLAGPIECVSLAAHVGLPGVAAGFASAAGLLLAAEGAADFGAAGADVDIGDAAIAAAMAEEGFGGNQIGGEHGRREALRHIVVPADGVVESIELDKVKDGGEDLFVEDRHGGLGAHQGGMHVAPLQGLAAEEDLPALLAYAAEAIEHVLDAAAIDVLAHDP